MKAFQYMIIFGSIILAILIVMLLRPGVDSTQSEEVRAVLAAPEEGMYFGAFAGFGSYEETVSRERIETFQSLVNKKISWAYFSQNWFNGIEFPQKRVDLLKGLDITPYIRLMPRSNFSNLAAEQEYTLEKISNGVFDKELTAWAQNARQAQVPLIIEFGTEVNGDWFPWNGQYNGATSSADYQDPRRNDGNERFIGAYRHIIDIFETERVHNVTWVYHVNAVSQPDTEWNQLMSYYPGDEYIDWIGLSVYGAQSSDAPLVHFTEVLDPAYDEITAATDKPIAVVEAGVVEGNTEEAKSEWFADMFDSLKSNLYPQIKGFSYWHSRFTNEEGEDVNLRIDSSTSALRVFREEIQDPFFISHTSFTEVVE